MLKRYFRRYHPDATPVETAFYEVSRWILALFATFGFRARRRGGMNVPQTGAYLLVCNHQSFIDPPFIGITATHRHLDYIARAGLFAMGPLGWLLNAYHCVPINEKGGDAAAMREALRRLAAGKAVLLFPEGARTPDGTMQEFKRGVAVLLKRAKCPVIPAAVEGCYEAWPRKRKIPRFGGPIDSIIGEPIPHEELLADGPDAALDRIEAEVRDLHARLITIRRGEPDPGRSLETH